MLMDFDVVVEEDDVGLGIARRDPDVAALDKAKITAVLDDSDPAERFQELHRPISAPIVHDNHLMGGQFGVAVESGKASLYVRECIPREDYNGNFFRHRLKLCW